MATTSSTILSLVFKDAEDAKITLNYNYFDPNATASKVSSLMDTIVSNGSIYKRVPNRKVKAFYTQKDVTDIAV